MRLTMIGTGYVGLVSGVCFAEMGHDVVCVDVNPERIASLQRGEMPIFEPGLAELTERNVNAHRLSFSGDIASSMRGCDVAFIAVGTPTRAADGEADLQYVFAAASQIAATMSEGTVVVIKSTVPVGTNLHVRDIIAQRRPGVVASVASNPEFLREGFAVQDFMQPDRVVVGSSDTRAADAMERLYRPLALHGVPVIATTPENAELIKYSANAFLALKVSFANELADLCEAVGGDVAEVTRGLGLDARIGPKFLQPGPGFGGSCLPKDTRAYAALGHKNAARQSLIERVIELNQARKLSMVDRILAAMPAGASRGTVAVLGIAFKANTDDVREAPSLTIIPALQRAGLTVRAHDPEAMKAAAPLLPGVSLCDDPYQAAEGADAVLVLTDWSEYAELELPRLANAMRGNLLFDTRNLYRPEDVTVSGLLYRSLGRSPPVELENQPPVRAPRIAAV